MACWFVNLLVGGFVGLLVCWLVGLLVGWFVGLFVGFFVVCVLLCVLLCFGFCSLWFFLLGGLKGSQKKITPSEHTVQAACGFMRLIKLGPARDGVS